MLRLFRKYYPIRNVIFASGEGLVIYLSVIIAAYIKLGNDLHIFDDWIVLKSMLITVVCQMALYYNDLYDLQVTNNYTELGIRLLQALGIATIFFGIAYYLIPQLMIGEGIFVIMIGLLILLIVSWRIGYTLVLEKGLFNQKLIIIGSGELAIGIIKEIRDKRDSGYEIDTILNEEDCREGACRKQLDMCDQAKAKNISKIIVALEEKRGNLPIEQLLKCRTEGIEILEGTSFYEMLLGKLYVKQINPSWLIFSDGFRKSPLKSAMKRTGDVLLSFIMLVMLSPMILITAILIKIDSKGPVIFSQERVGQNGKSFYVQKFRSMVADAEKSSGPVWASENDDRVTRVGRVIRKLRIDELPQLWNVLKGEMSFVGPRPERAFFVKQLEKDVPYYSERLTVKPGLTGWAQVSYPYGASVEDAIEKLNFDLFYTKNVSFLLDLLIIFRTVKIVFFGKGAR
jgi:sugar transferase (PEP-CTERM system associated)